MNQNSKFRRLQNTTPHARTTERLPGTLATACRSVFGEIKIGFCSLAPALVALLAVALGAPTASADSDKLKLTLGHVGGNAGVYQAGAARFAERVEELSGGRVTVKIVPRGALGNISEMWVQMQQGSLDLQVVDITAITLLKSAARANALITPFLFRDQDHYFAYRDSSLFADLANAIRDSTNIRYLGSVIERAPRVVATTNRAVKTLQDMKGLKMRVPPHPLFVEIFSGWGAVPVPTGAGNLFMSLKTGLVDGDGNGIIGLANNAPKASVIRHVTPINWKRSSVGLWFSEASWKRLTPEQHQWIRDAAADAEKQSRQEYDQNLKSAIEKLATLGIELHQPEISEFLGATERFVKKHEGTMWPAGEVAAIQAIRSQ